MHHKKTACGIVAIHEKNAEKLHTLIFIHGNSGSSRMWNSLITAPAFGEYRLLMIDLPGHGDSDAAPDPEHCYSLTELGKTVAELIKELTRGGAYVLVGFSLGTNILAESLAWGLSPVGIILISACIVRTGDDMPLVFHPNQFSGAFFSDEVTDFDLDGLATSCFHKQDAEILRDFKYDFTNTKIPFRSTLMKATAAGSYTNEHDLLNNAGIPILLLFGAEDKIVNYEFFYPTSLNKWRDRIFVIPDAGHFVFRDSELAVASLITEYLIESFKYIRDAQHS